MKKEFFNPKHKQPEVLRIQDSVYPEGYGTMEHYNSAWSNIFKQSEKAAKDPRHKQSMDPRLN